MFLRGTVLVQDFNVISSETCIPNFFICVQGHRENSEPQTRPMKSPASEATRKFSRYRYWKALLGCCMKPQNLEVMGDMRPWGSLPHSASPFVGSVCVAAHHCGDEHSTWCEYEGCWVPRPSETRIKSYTTFHFHYCTILKATFLQLLNL